MGGASLGFGLGRRLAPGHVGLRFLRQLQSPADLDSASEGKLRCQWVPAARTGQAEQGLAGAAGAQPDMPRGLRSQLRLLLLLLLLPPPPPPLAGALEPHDPAGPGEEAEEPCSGQAWPSLPFRDLRKWVRAAGALSRRYWALFSCRVWPKTCSLDKEAPAGALGWSLPLLGQQYLDILTTWYCSFRDCCDHGDCRVSNNFTGLQSDLSVRLHGQHLAQELVLTTVKSYLELPRPDKALALSFHGWSGTGKNFVARLLAENLYRDGLRSDCVKVFITMIHFPHPQYVDLYKEQLTEQVRKTQEHCHQTLFIFDEAEKLHPGLLEALGPHLERQVLENHRAESSRTIFLFLSNLGGNVINEVVLGLLKAGWSREDITMEHLESGLQAEIVASTDSGFGHSRLVKENLIDFFVPFLPLEYHHVRLCARDAFLSQELLYTEEALDEIAKMMVYVPKEEQMFSSQGCKSVSQRINYFLP
ncbi:torsin-3A [Myotis daubentonii]|uniref:torsin-3A n=1 Tax=Myotis daubentonii TaxID=98922 RepID=UPI002873DBF9|nr:torsin-3A [Myotis daubentonii]